MSRPVLRASLMAGGMLLVQLAWILTLPPFRGIDEFDHAYRAAAVAHGQWLPRSSAHVRGHGEYVEVPPWLVEAAHPVCASYGYTGHDNCNAVDRVGGYVEVASSAARYNPVFYWVIGKPASLFPGAANLYALRILGALICTGLVWCAGYALTIGFRTAWPLLAAATALTPVFVYSASIGAPNGAEMVSGLVVWSSMLALRSPVLEPLTERRLLALATGAAAVLVTTRLLGPLWLLLILAFTVPVVGRVRLVELARGHRRVLATCVGVVLLAVSAAVAWTRAAAPNALSQEPDLHLSHPLMRSVAQLPLWVFQSLAAFPTRNEPAPTVVYGTAFAALVVACGLAAVGVSRRQWGVIGLALVVWLGVQLTISVHTYSMLGAVWQGRYALPFAVGIPVLVGAFGDRTRSQGPPPGVVAITAVLAVAAHALSVVHVLLGERGSSPMAGSSAWVTAPPAVVASLVVAGGAVFLAAGVRAAREPA